MPRHWLMKSDPGTYAIDDLEADGRTCWEGVRNYEARNLMRDEMEEGDLVLFYHSQERPPGVVGVARIVQEGYPDYFAFDEDSPYHDASSTVEDPTWYMVDIEFVEKFDEKVTLAEIKGRDELAEMTLVNRSRLSVQPVAEEEFERIRGMAREG